MRKGCFRILKFKARCAERRCLLTNRRLTAVRRMKGIWLFYSSGFIDKIEGRATALEYGKLLAFAGAFPDLSENSFSSQNINYA